MEYSTRERFWLWVIALVGCLGVNGAFIWSMLARPEALAAALGNPVALAFLAEAFVLLGLLAYLLTRWSVSRVHWAWFVLLALAGSIAFALPVVLLWSERRAGLAGASAGARHHAGS